MCPDRQLLSAFYDGELDSKWHDEAESHIKNCTDCEDTVKNYTEIGDLLSESSVPGQKLRMERVAATLERKRQMMPERNISRVISMPLPVFAGAAAAMLIILFLGLFLLFTTGRTTEYVAEEIKDDAQDFEVISLEDAAAYIIASDEGFDLLITIPAGDTPAVTGEPQLIRKADYHRGQ